MDWGDTIALVLLIGVPAGIGVACLWYWRKVGREVALMTATPTSKASDVAAIAPGTLVELKGPLRCDAPLSGEFSHETCIYYRAKIEREYEYYTTDSKGRRERQTSRETVQDTIKFAPCVFDDGSGKVPIHFEGAEVEGVETVKRFESKASVGSLVASLLEVGNTDLGHHYTETVIRAGVPVFILGTVLDDRSVGAAPSKKNPFVITHKSEEEREKSLKSTRMWVLIIAIVCFAISVGLGMLAMKGLRAKAAKQKAAAVEMMVPQSDHMSARAVHEGETDSL